MSFWEFLDNIIREPPLWVAAILIAVLVAHVLKAAIEFATDRHRPNALIITLELMVVFVLAYLTIYLHYEKLMRATHAVEWHEEPLMMVCLLIVFSLVSILVYWFFKITIEGHTDSED